MAIVLRMRHQESAFPVSGSRSYVDGRAAVVISGRFRNGYRALDSGLARQSRLLYWVWRLWSPVLERKYIRYAGECSQPLRLVYMPMVPDQHAATVRMAPLMLSTVPRGTRYY